MLANQQACVCLCVYKYTCAPMYEDVCVQGKPKVLFKYVQRRDRREKAAGTAWRNKGKNNLLSIHRHNKK